MLSHYASLVRLNTNGSTDSTFNMIATQDVGAISSVAIQNNGKILVLGDNDNALYRYNSDGSPDKSFGNNGVVKKNPSSYPFSDVAIQNDGKILAINSTVLMRYNTNGSIDKTFGDNGKQTCFKSNADAGTVAIQSDGKIVVGGVKYYTEHFASANLALARFKANGKPDSTFNKDGELIYGFHAGNAIYTSTAIQKDGKIVAAGRAWNDSAFDYIITRYNTNGSLDKTFGKDGTVTTSISFEGSYDQYKVSIAIQSDGKIVASGGYSLERYNADGSLDKTFIIDKKRLIGLRHYIQLAAIQNDGKIVVTEIDYGVGAEGDEFNSWLTRYNTDGSLDKTYSVNGMQKVDYAPSSIAAQNDGKIIVAGCNFGQAVERFNTDGTLDNTFDNDGKAYFPAGNSTSSISILNNGKIIVAGNDYNDFLLWRFNTDGSLDQNFNNKSHYGVFKNSQFPYISTALQSNGKIVILGGDFLRFYKNGNQDYTFNISNEEKADFERTDIAIANNKLYVSGGDHYGIVEKYLLDTTSNTAPTVSITTPPDNTTFIAPANIKLIAAASDVDGAISKVEFYNGSTLVHTETVARYAYELRNLPPGNYTFTAKATDNSGVATTSAPVHVSVVPNKGFTVRITKPSHNRTFAAPGYIHFEAAANDPDGTITKVEFYNDSTLLRIEYKFPYTYVWKNVPGGTYSITARATNNKGAVAISAPVIVTVTRNIMIVSNKPSSVNNKITISNVISLKAWPNPANGLINIHTKGLQQNKQSTISIISASGVTMKTMQINSLGQTQLDVSSLVSGVYTMKVISGGNVIYKQFVKL
jgi:uncharacterized delta-60 repeat protein